MNPSKYTETGFSMGNTLNYLQGLLKKVTSNRIVNNFSTITLSNILVQGITIFSSIKIAKALAPDDFGIYSYLLVLSNIYLVLSGMGMRQVIIRTIAVNPSQSHVLFRKSFLLRTLIFLPLVASIVIYNDFFSKIHFDQLSVILLSANILFLSIWDTLESVNYGYQSMKQPSIIQLFSTALWVVIILLVPVEYIQVNIAMGITVALQILRTGVLYYMSVKKGFISLRAKNVTPLKINLIRESSSFFLLSVFTLITTQIPVVYLEQNTSDTEIAFYNIALRIIGPVQMLLLTFMNVLYPVVSRIFANDGEKFTNSIKNVFIFLMLIGNLGAFTLSLFSKEIILLMYGEAYTPSALVFNVQIWYTILYSILCYIGMILSAINKQVLLAKLSFAYAIVATPCLFIGSKYGATGLSMGFLVSALVNLSYHYYYLQKSLPTEIPWRVIFLTTGIFFLLMLVTYLSHNTHFLVRIATGLTTIGVLLFLLRKPLRRSIKELIDTR